MKINPSVFNLKESATLAINQLAIEQQKNGKEIYHFGFGESPFPVPESLRLGMIEHSWRKNYLPSSGLGELKEAIVRHYSKNFAFEMNAKRIMIGPGSKELIYDLLLLLEGELLLPVPCWVSYEPQASLTSKKIHYIPCSYENNYKLDLNFLEDLAQKISSQKVMIINSPSNPTGQCYDENELADLAKIVEAHNIIVISDEIYAEVYWEKSCQKRQRAPSLASFAPNHTIITSGISKAYNAGGYRLGFCSLPNDQLIKPFSALISETFSAVNTPTQYAAKSMFEDETLLNHVDACNKVRQSALNEIGRVFRKGNLRFLNAQGGFYLFPDFTHHREALNKKGIYTSTQLCKQLIDDIGVVFLPGCEFGISDEALAVRAAIVDFDGKDSLDVYNNNLSLDSCFERMFKGSNLLNDWLENLS